ISRSTVGGNTPQGANAMVNFGTGTSAYAYVATDPATNPLYRWDGSAWTNPAIGYPGQFLAVTPGDNRVVLADGLRGNQSRVRFSDPGAPETFGANNYVDLTPNDGEAIAGVATWQNYVVVAKQTKFFVFYGTSSDSTGQPVFNYRTVNTG